MYSRSFSHPSEQIKLLRFLILGSYFTSIVQWLVSTQAQPINQRKCQRMKKEGTETRTDILKSTPSVAALFKKLWVRSLSPNCKLRAIKKSGTFPSSKDANFCTSFMLNQCFGKGTDCCTVGIRSYLDHYFTARTFLVFHNLPFIMVTRSSTRVNYSAGLQALPYVNIKATSVHARVIRA